MESAVPGFAFDIDDPTSCKLKVGIKELYKSKSVILDEKKLSQVTRESQAFAQSLYDVPKADQNSRNTREMQLGDKD